MNEEAKPQEEGMVSEAEAEVRTEEGEQERLRTTKGASASLREAWKQVESFGEALSAALQGRGNVVMVRVNDKALEHLDMLVEAEITKSRSESAAFLISEGIKANQALFERISAITRQIAELREQLRREVKLSEGGEEAREPDTPSEAA